MNKKYQNQSEMFGTFSCGCYNLKMVQLIAHRGARTLADYSKIAPENTLPAFEAARDLGLGVELDVQATKDGVLVVYHDDELGDVFELQSKEKKKLIDTHWGELFKAQLNVKAVERETNRMLGKDNAYVIPDHFKSLRIPKLNSVIKTLPKAPIYLELKTNNKDVKNKANNLLEERVANFIYEQNLYDRVTVISFSTESLKRIKKLDPNIKTGLDIKLTQWQKPFLGLLTRYAKLRLKVDSIHPAYQDVSKKFVKKAHKKGLEFTPWVHRQTRDEETEMIPELISMGVDGIITNAPDLKL